jgi:hypothetical protein
MVDGFALWIEDAVLEGNVDARFQRTCPENLELLNCLRTFYVLLL